MSTSNAPRKYDHVHAVIFHFLSDELAPDDARGLAAALRGYNYDVTVENETGWRLRKSARSEEAASEEFASRLHQVDAKKGSKLLIFCYIGHGLVRQGRLVASSEEEDKTITMDLTRFQEIACERGDADALFLFECCHGGHVGFKIDKATKDEKTAASKKLVTTMAAGLDTIDIGHKSDFSRRLVENLVHVKGNHSVDKRFDTITKKLFPKAPGTIMRHCGPDEELIGLCPLESE